MAFQEIKFVRHFCRFYVIPLRPVVASGISLEDILHVRFDFLEPQKFQIRKRLMGLP